MKVEGTSLSSRSSVSSAGVLFGDPPLAPKAMGLCFFRTVHSRCLRLVRQAPSRSYEIRFRRLRADFRSGDREVPGMKKGVAAPRGRGKGPQT